MCETKQTTKYGKVSKQNTINMDNKWQANCRIKNAHNTGFQVKIQEENVSKLSLSDT